MQQGSIRRGLAALAITAFALASTNAYAIDTITVGFLDDMSGAAAESGNDGLHAVQLAVDEINEKGGIAGRKIDLKVYDGKTDPQLSATFATRFAEDDMGLVLIGGNPAVPTGAVIPVINEYELPYFTLSAATDSFTEPSTPYHFRVGPKNSQDAAAIAEVIARQGFKTAAVVNNSLPYGIDGGDAVTAALEAAGVKVVSHEVYDVNATDLSPQIATVRDSDAEVLVIWPYPADGARVLRTLSQLNVTIPRVVARIALYDTLRQLAAEAGDGALVTNTVDPERPEVAAFFERFNARFGQRPPTMYIAMGYDAAKIAFEAIDTPEVNAALEADDVAAARTAIRDAVERIGEFDGLNGLAGVRYSFGPGEHHGPPDASWFVWLEVADSGKSLIKADMDKFKPAR